MPQSRDNQPFRAAWEPTGYDTWMVVLMRDHFTSDSIRYAIERIPPREYLAMSYFERVIVGVASVYVERRILSREDLERRAGGIFPLARPLPVADTGSRNTSEFGLGDSVLVKHFPTQGHSRVPRYVWGKRGRVIGVGPIGHFPGQAAYNNLADGWRERTYRVCFDSQHLWPDVEDQASVVVDLFQSYLQLEK